MKAADYIAKAVVTSLAEPHPDNPDETVDPWGEPLWRVDLTATDLNTSIDVHATDDASARAATLPVVEQMIAQAGR